MPTAIPTERAWQSGLWTSPVITGARTSSASRSTDRRELRWISARRSRRDRHQSSTLAELELPAFFVYESMMPTTQQDKVGECLRTAIGPMFDVVRIRPRRRIVAAWKPADLVERLQRATHGP